MLTIRYGNFFYLVVLYDNSISLLYGKIFYEKSGIRNKKVNFQKEWSINYATKYPNNTRLVFRHNYGFISK